MVATAVALRDNGIDDPMPAREFERRHAAGTAGVERKRHDRARRTARTTSPAAPRARPQVCSSRGIRMLASSPTLPANVRARRVAAPRSA